MAGVFAHLFLVECWRTVPRIGAPQACVCTPGSCCLHREPLCRLSIAGSASGKGLHGTACRTDVVTTSCTDWKPEGRPRKRPRRKQCFLLSPPAFQVPQGGNAQQGGGSCVNHSFWEARSPEERFRRRTMMQEDYSEVQLPSDDDWSFVDNSSPRSVHQGMRKGTRNTVRRM